MSSRCSPSLVDAALSPSGTLLLIEELLIGLGAHTVKRRAPASWVCPPPVPYGIARLQPGTVTTLLEGQSLAYF